jgi:hypothetical protein
MDVRFIAYAGYQLQEVGISIVVSPPGLEGKELGTKLIQGRDMTPSIRGSFDSEDNTRNVNTFPPPKLGQ